MIKIAIPGVNGRMGQAVAKAVLQANDLQLVIATVRDTCGLVGNKVANSDVIIEDKILNADFDVMIDFTLPEGVIEHVKYCAENHKAMIIGATGFSVQQMEIIRQASQEIPIVLAANMSIGVNICYKLLATASEMLNNYSQISIMDLHHQYKKDAPSGTAKHMAKVIAENSGRETSQIEMVSQRKGEIVGSHIVTFKSSHDTITIAHEAEDRGIYAHGAITAARWIVGKNPGFYSMLDVIG